MGSEIAREQGQTLREHSVRRKVPVVWPELRTKNKGGEAEERGARADEFEHGSELPGADVGVRVDAETKK